MKFIDAFAAKAFPEDYISRYSGPTQVGRRPEYYLTRKAKVIITMTYPLTLIGSSVNSGSKIIKSNYCYISLN